MRYCCIVFVAVLVLAFRCISASEYEECYPSWYDPNSNKSSNEQCPYGIALPASVTLHNDFDPMLQAFTLVYGYTSTPAYCFIWSLMIICRGTRELLYGLAVLILVFGNEYVIKGLFKEPKPEEQCAITCGMPSGHSATTIMVYTLFTLDQMFRVKRSAPCTCRKLLCTCLLVNTGPINILTWLYFQFFWGAILLPVGISRVLNNDHSWLQVLYGSLEGLFCGIITYNVYLLIACFCKPWKIRCCLPCCSRIPGCHYLVKNNITLPFTYVYESCFSSLEETNDSKEAWLAYPAATESDDESPEDDDL